MKKETKEPLSKTEHKKVGDTLLELIAACPHIPKDAKIKYQSKDVGKCVYILTAGGGIKSRNVLGGFTAELNIQIAYQGFPQDNGNMINAQSVVDNITRWLEDVPNLPKLTDHRTITKITTGDSFPVVEEVEGDKSTIFVADVSIEYEVD